jgi:hypothetical protein
MPLEAEVAKMPGGLYPTGANRVNSPIFPLSSDAAGRLAHAAEPGLASPCAITCRGQQAAGLSKLAEVPGGLAP